MAQPTLEQARKWFEQRFKEVHVFNRETHPKGLAANRCPTGDEYIIVIDYVWRLEGEDNKPNFVSESQSIQDWFWAVMTLYDVRGRPPYLWWREEPVFQEGEGVYSRFVMTHRGSKVNDAA